MSRFLLALRRLAARLLLPATLRARHGEEMEAAFREQLGDARRGGSVQAARVFLRELVDLWRAAASGRRVGTSGGGGGGMDAIVRDIRIAARGLARRPGFAAVATLSLGLGIGGATAMFALVEGVLLRPLAYREPGRIAQVFLSIPSLGWDRGPVSFPVVDEWRRRSGEAFESLSAFQAGVRRTLDVDGAPRLVSGVQVTGELFETLGRQARLGRTLTRADEGPGRAPVVVLSHAMWSEELGGDADVVGRPVRLGTTAYTVVGVMPPDFPPLAGGERFWIPLAVDPASMERDMSFLRVIGRLRGDLDAAGAAGAMERLTRVMEAEDPLGVEGRSARVVPHAEVLTGDVRLQLLVLLGAVGLLLAIACANLAGLLLVRGAARGRELALREALGAGRVRIVRALLAESLVLAVAGAGFAIPVARLLLAGVRAFGPTDLPRLADVGLDATTLLFCAGAAAGSAVAFGLVPALRVSRAGVAREGGGSAGPSRLQRALVVGQVAVATVLLTGAGLLGASLLRLRAVDTGFEADGVLTFRLSPAPGLSRAEVDAFHARVLEGLEALPGVDAAGATWALPLGGMYGSSSFRAEGRPPDEEHLLELVPVLGDYLDAMRMRVVAGRGLEPGDGAQVDTPILVGEAFAARAWPGEDAVGRRLLEEEDGEIEATYRVVGVVADVTLRGPGSEPEMVGYWPHAATPWASDLYHVVRTGGDPAALVSAVREVVRGVDDRVPLADVSTMPARLSRHLAAPRFRALLVGAFAAGAGCLSLLGIYGVTSYAVGRRTREIGVRMALGAERVRLLAGVLASGLALAGVGAALGLAGAAAGSRVVASLLFGVTPLEPGVYALVGLAVVVAAAAACWVPARRAATVSPTVALKVE